MATWWFSDTFPFNPSGNSFTPSLRKLSHTSRRNYSIILTMQASLDLGQHTQFTGVFGKISSPRWLVPENGYVFVKARVDAILELISRPNSMVKFQRHCLVDLPVELLENIVRNASLEDAQIISSTCKRLRSSSQRHIFISRRLSLNTVDRKDLRLLPTEQRKGVVLERYLKEHVRGLSEVSFLLGRRDITQKVKIAQLRVRSVFGVEFWADRQYYGTDVQLNMHFAQSSKPCRISRPFPYLASHPTTLWSK
ncbi:hypothetical protein IW262DRAFT_126815 [Armillaria fumosa]|nr:hypothetical protein IW262DRAFT_126815 [Armillaria fumosa]